MPNPRPLCAAPHCAIRNHHTDACDNPQQCWGCLPRWAADGLRLCQVCTARIRQDAARLAILHRDLETALIGGGANGEKTTGTGGGPAVPRDEVMEARDAIRLVLTVTVKVITGQRGVTLPREPYLQQLPAGFIGPPRLLYRTTGDLGRLALFVGRHHEWLAAHRNAATCATNLRQLAGDGRLRAMAYPVGADRLYVGDCPMILTDLDGNESVCDTRLYQYPDQALIACEGCDTQETVEQWQRWIVGDTAAHVDAYALAAHLAVKWMRPVDPAAVRQWASRGKIGAVEEPDPVYPGKTRAKRDSRNRVLYDLVEVVAYAERIWGPPAGVRRKMSA
ncbi:hypothetical protein GCM10010399_44370 [Dactylosporangium fulvum]|uniref:Uncharacterized protein n=1 Tax=Dactylosporangium fulvum TaxID=53359 RepID=A0ABY5W943_9ACTN|nr:hypothetical protein [Dactylosporangium fulvum]UWP85895.1 hypothetical protein Dfulv_17250 [Dactylosporangium fulvum]